jgi:hypothetical protein
VVVFSAVPKPDLPPEPAVLPTKNVPKIALITSGGGFRAMIAYCGAYKVIISVNNHLFSKAKPNICDKFKKQLPKSNIFRPFRTQDLPTVSTTQVHRLILIIYFFLN